ncbi:MAG: tetratricopeptide repeat protein [Brevinemataceae bacterium]
MDIMTLASCGLAIVLTLYIGSMLFQKCFPFFNLEIAVFQAFQKGDYELVVNLTEDKLNSGLSYQVFVYAGRARVLLKQYREALKWFETAVVKLALKSQEQIFLEIEIADTFMALLDLDRAEIHYRTVLNLEPTNNSAAYKLALVHYKKGRFDICRKDIRTLLKNNPKLIEARRLYAESLAELGLYSKAVRHFGLLIRAGEKVVSYNYFRTLKALKIYQRAYGVCVDLLESNMEPTKHKLLAVELLELCKLLQKYHEGLGLADKYLSMSYDPKTLFALRYQRACLLYAKGDLLTALQEFHLLYQEHRSYKDLAEIVDRFEYLLSYSFLYNYFTSNHAVFEAVITRISLSGTVIIRRHPQYYLCSVDDIICIFYRDIREIPLHVMNDIERVILHTGIELKQLCVFSLGGISSKFTLNVPYAFQLIEDQEFLLRVKEASASLENPEKYGKLTFAPVFQDAPQVIIHDQPVSEDKSTEDIQFIRDRFLPENDYSQI